MATMKGMAGVKARIRTSCYPLQVCLSGIWNRSWEILRPQSACISAPALIGGWTQDRI